MAIFTQAESHAVLLHLLTEQIPRPNEVLLEELFDACNGDSRDETEVNVALVTTAALRNLAWLLTVAGGQTTAGALNIIMQSELWSQVDQIERDMDVSGDD